MVVYHRPTVRDRFMIGALQVMLASREGFQRGRYDGRGRRSNACMRRQWAGLEEWERARATEVWRNIRHLPSPIFGMSPESEHVLWSVVRHAGPWLKLISIKVTKCLRGLDRA